MKLPIKICGSKSSAYARGLHNNYFYATKIFNQKIQVFFFRPGFPLREREATVRRKCHISYILIFCQRATLARMRLHLILTVSTSTLLLYNYTFNFFCFSGHRAHSLRRYILFYSMQEVKCYRLYIWNQRRYKSCRKYSEKKLRDFHLIFAKAQT